MKRALNRCGARGYIASSCGGIPWSCLHVWSGALASVVASAGPGAVLSECEQCLILWVSLAIRQDQLGHSFSQCHQMLSLVQDVPHATGQQSILRPPVAARRLSHLQLMTRAPSVGPAHQADWRPTVRSLYRERCMACSVGGDMVIPFRSLDDRVAVWKRYRHKRATQGMRPISYAHG